LAQAEGGFAALGRGQAMAWNKLDHAPLGFGAFKIGRNTRIKYPQDYPLPDDQTADRLLNQVLDLGIGYIDTAPAYGISEERIGRFIGHRQSEYLLSTKVGETFLDDKSTYDYSEPAVRQSIQRSLNRLKTDRLDLVFVHSNGQDRAVLEQTEVVPTLQALRDQGLIRAIGFSGYSDEGLQLALPWSDALMVEYHLENRALGAVISKASAQGVAVIVKKGLASGKLPPAESIEFVLSNPGVTSLVVGGLNIEHLRQNLDVAKRVRGHAVVEPHRS